MSQLTEELRHVLHVIRERLLLADADAVVAALGISKSNVYRLRNGGVPSMQTLELLAYYFDTGHTLEQSPDPKLDLKGPAQPPAIRSELPATPEPHSKQPARPPWE